MKRQTIMKSTLCLLMALVCNVAWANFTQQWTKSPVAPWGTTDLTEEQYPAEVGANLITAQGSKTGTVRKAETDVCAPADGTVTLVFNYVDGGHKLNILGVDLVGADGQVKASDYHYGKAPGDGTTKTYTLTDVVAGDYTLRYFVCNNSSDGDQLNMTNGNIVVTGLDLNRLKYNIGDGKYNDRSGSSWRNGWTSTNAAKPSFTISVGANNMNAGSTEYIGMRPGTAAGGCTYTLTLGEPFIRYSFEAKSNNASPAHVITIDGKATTISSTEWTTITVDVYGTTTQFHLTGSNNQDLYIRNIKFVQEVPVASAAEFMNGGVYTFVTARGKMGATESNAKVISTARTSVSDTNTDFFKWTVYKSNNGNYYLYNVGKQQFMGVQSANNTEIDFVATPAGKKLTFKQSSSADYPIMLSTDNNGVVNHSTNHGGGLINWTGGWNTLNDGGSNHKVTLVSKLPEATLQEIANKVEAYDRRLYVTATVEGSWENNPNTHFGSVRATASTGTLTSKLKTTPSVATVDYDGLNETTIDFTREYRGFEFQGFFLGEENLGKSFTLTEELKSSITAETPLIAKFTATEPVTLFYDDDPFPYRIPAIATTSTGRLIAVSDYRHCLDDIGLNRWGKGYRIDLVIRTSDDNGKTWSPIKTIAEGIDNSQANDCAYGDAAIAVVGEEVVVMAVAGSVSYGDGSAGSETEPKKTNRLVRIYSANNGENWVKEDVTEKVYGYDGSLYPTIYTSFFGSGKLAVDPNIDGEGTARIYGPMLTQGMGNIVIYSDDMGLTWKKLGTGGQVAGANEPKIEILPSGQLLFSARRNGGRNFNVFTYTDKASGAGTWSNAVDGCDNEGENGTNGETFLIDAQNASGQPVKLLLQSQPVGGGAWDRENVSIWYKEISSDANHNHTPSEIAGGWTKGMQVSHQLSAYSTMSLQKDGRIAFFFEEAPCYQNEYKYGYCMVYMPLTIEEITKNKYFSRDADLTTERAINVVLTDAQGNEYRQQVTSALGGVATKLTTDYPFITLGDNATLESADGESFTYTNTVTLPFKVSNNETTVWHNIYWPSNQGSGYPVYLSSSAADDTYVSKVTETVVYGNSTFNTADYANKISWAVYQVGDGFTFKFKNKLTGKFIQAMSVVSSNAQNVKYVDEAEATAFELDHDKNGNSRIGDYALKASVNSTVGYLCSSSATYGYATHHSSKGHQGAWVKFVEAPDFETLFAEVNAVLNMFGDGLGQYSNITEANLAAVTEAKNAMQAPGSVKLNTLNEYKNYTSKTEGGELNRPKDDQFFRVAYDYGGNVGILYMQGENSTVKGVKFTADKGAASIWQYRDGGLYSYTAEKYLNEVNDERGLKDTKQNATFSSSTRAKGKYNITCTSYIHANSNGNGQYYSDHCSSNNCAAHDLILEEIEPTTVTISNLGYSTLYSEVALSIPEGEVVTAYTGTLNETNEEITLTLNKVEGGTIPANTAVILKAEADTYSFNITEKVPAIENNALRGTATDISTSEVTDGVVYTLQPNENEDGVVFMQYTGTTLNANKAYLVLDGNVAQSISIRFEGTTDIEHSEIRDQHSEIIYDLQGRRVLNPTKGIYIVNGKKVIR